MKEKKIWGNTIVCPCCGAEYLPGEIYLPKYFLGQPKDIEKDYNTHKITYFDGIDMDTDESFTCEYCGTPFNVSAKISFVAEENKLANFSSDYATSLKKEKLFMSEEA